MTSTTVPRFERLIEQATVDCYNDSEQICGFFTEIEQALDVPFEAAVLGSPVTVRRIELAADDRIVAICRRNGVSQRIALVDLALPTPAPDGAEWIQAFRYWMRRTGRT